MKKLLLAAVGVATALGSAALLPAGHGQQAQQPPAAPREPFTVPISQPGQGSSSPGYLPTTSGFPQLPTTPPQGLDVTGGVPTAVVPRHAIDPDRPSLLRDYLSQNFDEPDPNLDMAIQPSCGNYCICVISYTGNDAPRWAREMALELRGNPKYKLPAYVFTTGAEERKAELKRIKQYVEQQTKYLEDNHFAPDTPIRVPVIRYELQCAVLVGGGYKDWDSAKRALELMKKLEQPDPNKVKLHSGCLFEMDDRGQSKGAKDMLLNPFTHAMVVPNPGLAGKHSGGTSAEDMVLLKSLNADEPYNLLKCPKKYTLVVKPYSLDMQVGASGTGFGTVSTNRASNKQDMAAISARNLAKVLREGPHKLEVYVLHTRYCSYVTVGSYDSPDDSRLIRDQEVNLPKISQELGQTIKLLARPMVMEVPR